MIPLEKWPKKNKTYHIVFAKVVMPQKQLAVELSEIFLDESCAPYEYFLAKRFVVNLNDLDALISLVKTTKEADSSLTDLDWDQLKQTTHVVETRS